jgi:hypothetical protein
MAQLFPFSLVVPGAFAVRLTLPATLEPAIPSGPAAASKPAAEEARRKLRRLRSFLFIMPPMKHKASSDLR